MDKMSEHDTKDDVGNAKNAVKNTVANFTGDRETQVEVKPDKVDGAVHPKVDGAKDADKETQEAGARKKSPMHEKG
jgi:uncharacterized protein YjbJ (UPF0337 family)